jgi:hypothetical protein
VSLIGSTLRERCARIAVGVAFMVGPILACNGDDEYDPYYGGGPVSGSSGFTNSGTSSSGHAIDAGKELCETATEGTSCYTAHSTSTSCEQGTSANSNCNPYLFCNDRRVWEQEPPQRAVCASPAVCPATYTASAPDDLCKRPDAIGLLCEYDEGVCGCAPVGGVDRSVPDFPKEDAGENEAGTADDEDAGAPADAGPRTYEWKCIQADRDAGCPRRRPREGIACVRPLNCDYGYCVFEVGLRMACLNGSWVRDFTRSEECDQ